MKTYRRAAPLAALTVLALGLAACGGGDSGEEDPTEEPTEEPPVTIETPDGFNADSPSWEPISDIDSTNTRATVTPDGTHYAYATVDGENLIIGQINLETGERTEEHAEPLLTPLDGATTIEEDEEQDQDTGSSGGNADDEDPDAPEDFGIVYSGDRLVVAQVGIGEDDETQWNAAIFGVGRSGDPTVLSEPIEASSNEVVTLPTPRSGPIISVGARSQKTSYLVNAEQGEFSEVEGDFTQSFDGCGDSSSGCDLLFDPRIQDGLSTVGTFREVSSRGQIGCSESNAPVEEESGFDGCLTGFATDDWASNDPEIAPEGAEPASAFLYAAGDGYVVGAWTGEDGGTIYRSINLTDPEGSHAVITCEGTVTGSAFNRVTRSPSGQYLTAGSLLFDTQSGEGRCFEDSPRGEPTFVSVDNDGTAWGTPESNWAVDRYTEEVVKGTLGGGIESVGNNVGLPLSFVTAEDTESGVFAVAEDAVDGQRAVVAYPLE